MRYLYQDTAEVLHARAKAATEKFVRTLLRELDPFLCTWMPNKHESVILWLTDITDEVGVYGTSEGMYLSDDGGTVNIYFPKTTQAYLDFCEAITELHENDDNLFVETLMSWITIFYDGNSDVKLTFTTNVVDMPVEAYNSAKVLAEEMVEMLSGFEAIESVTYYEGDDDGKVGFNAKCNNYDVGFNVSYQFR